MTDQQTAPGSRPEIENPYTVNSPPGFGEAMVEVAAELYRAYEKFPRPQATFHEAYGVLTEEVRELELVGFWGIHKDGSQLKVITAPAERREKIREEAIQVAAMAIRTILDVCVREVDVK